MIRADAEPWKAQNVERRLWAYNAVPAVGTKSFISQIKPSQSIPSLKNNFPPLISVLDPHSLLLVSDKHNLPFCQASHPSS